MRSSASHLRPVSSSGSDWSPVARKGERAAPVHRCLLVLVPGPGWRVEFIWGEFSPPCFRFRERPLILFFSSWQVFAHLSDSCCVCELSVGNAR